jgi:hypothetical protein
VFSRSLRDGVPPAFAVSPAKNLYNLALSLPKFMAAGHNRCPRNRGERIKGAAAQAVVRNHQYRWRIKAGARQLFAASAVPGIQAADQQGLGDNR